MSSFGAQDRWVIGATAGTIGGFFLDVGCGDPIAGNNTIKLERLGWRGLLVDVNLELEARIRAARSSTFVCADAAEIDWRDLALPSVVDYLSFDVDGRSVPAFQNLPLDEVRFRHLTIEHDYYCFGEAPRDLMRARLSALGYDLLCPDVMCQGLVYEDWWVDPTRVDLAKLERFRTRAPTECLEIAERA